MQISFEIIRITCLRTTAELGADEIYCAGIFFAGEKQEEALRIREGSRKSYATEVMTDVRRGDVRIPAFNTFLYDLKKNEVFGFSLLLFEKDRGDLYEKWKNGKVDFPDSLLDEVDLSIPSNPLNWKDWVIPAIKLLVSFFKFLRRDDQIRPHQLDAEPFAYHVDDPAIWLPKKFMFKSGFGKYEVEGRFSNG